jgi:hypothetical protein
MPVRLRSRLDRRRYSHLIPLSGLLTCQCCRKHPDGIRYYNSSTQYVLAVGGMLLGGALMGFAFGVLDVADAAGAEAWNRFLGAHSPHHSSVDAV